MVLMLRLAVSTLTGYKEQRRELSDVSCESPTDKYLAKLRMSNVPIVLCGYADAKLCLGLAILIPWPC